MARPLAQNTIDAIEACARTLLRMAEKDEHDCDFCSGTFECKTRTFTPSQDCKNNVLGHFYCLCEQEVVGLIVPHAGDTQITSRLAFWCSRTCYEEDFPQDSESESEFFDIFEEHEEQVTGAHLPMADAEDDEEDGEYSLQEARQNLLTTFTNTLPLADNSDGLPLPELEGAPEEP